MADKKMLIIPAGLADKIDENRGDLSQADFIEFLIDSFLKNKEVPAEAETYATHEEMGYFEEDMKNLMRSFLDFFVTYGMELGKQKSVSPEIEELASKLHGLEKDLGPNDNDRTAKIRWKN